MTKKDLLSAIPFSKAVAEPIVDAVFDVINNALSDGDKVVIKGFGTFSVKTRKTKRGINPKTMESIVIPEKKVVKFKSQLKLD